MTFVVSLPTDLERYDWKFKTENSEVRIRFRNGRHRIRQDNAAVEIIHDHEFIVELGSIDDDFDSDVSDDSDDTDDTGTDT